MPDYKENPQLALEALKDITDKFAGGVSASEIAQTAPLLQRDQNMIHDTVSNSIASVVKQTLENFWKENEMDKKLKKMKELENSAPPNPARRPKTGIVDSGAIEAACLLRLKTHLEKKVGTMKKESMALQSEVNEFKTLIDQQMKDISNSSL